MGDSSRDLNEDREPLSGEDHAEEEGDNGEVAVVFEGGSGCCSSCCDPRSKLHRFIFLIFMSFLNFGSYFCYDNPGALQHYFIEDMRITTSQFAELYSWYSWPNVVLCFVGGFLLDSVFGIKLGTIIFCGFLFLGQIVFALGGYLNLFPLMIVGRFIFGVGGESLSVAQNTYAVNWFKGKELNMVFGIQMSFARVGSTVNFNTMVPLYKWMGSYYEGYQCLGIVLFIAAGTCFLSLFCALVLALFDIRADRILNRQSHGTGETVKLSDVRHFPKSFWLLCAVCATYYVAIFPFIGLGTVFFERKWDYSVESAGTINSALYVVSAVSSPFFGILVDKTGRNLLYVLVAVVVTILAHVLLAFTFLNPYVGMVLLGLGYSLLAGALWPMISLVVADHQLGTAFGLAQALQNLGLAVMTKVAGEIVDQGGYLMLEVFFIGFLSFSLVMVLVIWFVDGEGRLNMTPQQRALMVQGPGPQEEPQPVEGPINNDDMAGLIQDDH